MRTRAPRWLVVAAALAVLGVLAARGTISLLAWTDRVFPLARLPLVLGLYFAGWLAIDRAAAHHRRWLLLATSVALAAAFSVPFLILAAGWIALYHRVLYAGVAARWKLGFVVATFAAWLIACDVPLAPGFHAAHPVVMLWGYVFAVSWTFRIAWVFHQAHLEGYLRPPLADFLLYFLFAPFFIVLPYMFAIPRFDRFRASLVRHDPDVEWSGVRTLALSMLVVVGLHAATAVWDPRFALEALLRDGRYLAAAPIGLLYYPGQAVVEAVGNAGILLGLVRILGIDLGPSFDRPLAARSVTEWWRRWNTHFRDLLVDLCWYPVLLRLRRKNPYLGIWAGCAAVFLVGSVGFHWLGKHYFQHGTPHRLPIGVFCESVAMTVVVGVALSRETWRKRRRLAPAPAGIVRVAAQRLATYALVFASVIGVGRGAQYWFEVRPFERLQPAWARARVLAAIGRAVEAEAAVAADVPALIALVDQAPLDALRQSQLAFALALPSPRQDLVAAAEHLALARVYVRPFAPQHLLWLAAAESLTGVPSP